VEPLFLSERQGKRPMGVYLCHAKRIHVVYDFFDVCLGLEGFKKLREMVSSLLVDPGSASSFALHFACAGISVPLDDLLTLRGVLDEAMDRVVELELEDETRSDPHVGNDWYEVGTN